MVKNRIYEGILAKTGEMSFYPKQLRDEQMNNEQHITDHPHNYYVRRLDR